MRPPQMLEEDGVLIVSLDDPGALNDGHAVGVRQPLYQAIQERTTPRVAVDLALIDFLSSSGIALMIGLKRRVDAQQGQLVLYSVHPHVLDIFRVMRLGELFVIAGNKDEALELLPPASTL